MIMVAVAPKAKHPAGTDGASAVGLWLAPIGLGISLAVLDTRLRYRRTTLGPFWITISAGMMVVAVGTIYGQIFGTPAGIGQAGYMAYFAVGTQVWAFATVSLTEGCVVFIQSGGLIKTLRVSLLLHVYRMLARNLVLLGHNAIIVVLLWLVIRWPLGWGVVGALAGFVLSVLALFGMVLVVGILSTRFRDLPQIVGTVLQLLFLVSPIIWPASSLRGARAEFLLYGNPVYYMIEVVRGPLLGEIPPIGTWAVAVLVAAVSMTMGLWLYVRLQHRVPYWL